MRVALALVLLAACGAEKSAPPVERDVVERAPHPAPPPPPPPPAEKVVQVLTGKAIYYGDKWDGTRTASGEIFDKHLWTAAHRSLPLGTRVRVVNLDNGKEVVVRVNDRGPYGNDRRRIIDVSQAAARVLDFAGKGEIPVRLEVLADQPRPQ
ncbi:MAG TPA: septal ring lytic transglycosylase RlpA family protein [Kofleriaceae bacterium]|nr:septal ring lytic transglycosylase RlpA family protein [Kofleriaceae bacterium]